MAMNNVAQSRIAWIDNIRLFAILCVLLYHSSQLVLNKYYFGWIIESFNMPLFFFISGMTSYKSLNKIVDFIGLRDFILKRFIRILLPCIFVSMLIFQKPCSYWFLLTLFYYLAAFACIKFCCEKFRLGEMAPYCIFPLLTLVNIPKVGNDQEFVLIFTIGLIFAKYKWLEQLNGDSRYKRWLPLILLVIWICLLPFYKSFYLNQFYQLLSNGDYHTFILRQIMALSFVLGSCLFYMNKRNIVTKMSEWGGKLWAFI